MIEPKDCRCLSDTQRRSANEHGVMLDHSPDCKRGMTEPKALSEKEMAQIKRAASASNHAYVDSLLGHIAALEADKAELLGHLRLMVAEVGAAETGTDDPAKAPGMVEYMLAAGACEAPHPGAALLEELASLRNQVAVLTKDTADLMSGRALVRARNDGLEKAAAWFRLKAKNRLAPLSNLGVAHAIDAMKEPEPTEPS